MIKRLPGEQDKRVKYVYPSEKGLAQEVFLRRVLQRWLDYLAEGVDPSFAEVVIEGLQLLAQRAQSVNLPDLVQKK